MYLKFKVIFSSIALAIFCFTVHFRLFEHTFAYLLVIIILNPFSISQLSGFYSCILSRIHSHLQLNEQSRTSSLASIVFSSFFLKKSFANQISSHFLPRFLSTLLLQYTIVVCSYGRLLPFFLLSSSIHYLFLFILSFFFLSISRRVYNDKRHTRDRRKKCQSDRPLHRSVAKRRSRCCSHFIININLNNN